jgi:hypothetical protein
MGGVGRAVAIASTAVALCGVAAPAQASPWLLREDQVVVSGRFDYQRARREFLDEYRSQLYPLEGKLRATTFDITGRVGIIDEFELELSVPLRVISYTSNPVILLPAPMGATQFDYYQENIIDLSRGVAGVGDIRLSGRYQLWRGAFASSFQLQLKTPTGYAGPAGTFGSQPRDAEDFQDNVGTYVRPENVQDDVTLGDGQVDLGAMMLVGWALPTKTFLRLDAGYLLRLGGAGDQVVGSFRVGQALGSRVLITAGTRMAYSVQDGETIGVSVAAEDPELPAEEYGGTTNLRLREVPLDHDRLSLGMGVIVRIGSSVETYVNYSRIVWGRNISAVETISMGVGVRFDVASKSE